MDWINSGSYTMFTHLAYYDEYGPGYHALHAEDGVPEHRHFTGITNGRTNLAFTMGLPLESAAFVSLPLDTFGTTARYTLADGVTPYTPPKTEIHHRNETLLGPGDAIVMGKRAWTLGDEWTLVPGLGLSVPLGRTEENPIALGHDGLIHQHIQFGSGTFDPMAGLEVSYSPMGAAWGVDAWALTRQTLYANGRGFMFGGRLGGGIYPRWQVIEGVTLSTGLEAVHEGQDRWRDAATGAFTSPENSGRQAVMGVLGISWRPAGWGVTISPQLRKIAWQHTQGGEMDQPLAASLSLSYTFGDALTPPSF
jgi:hypothetical protein